MAVNIKRILLVPLLLVVFITVTGMIILNQAQFGQLPKGERLERVKSSPNYIDGEFRNFKETPVLTSNKGSFSTMLDFVFSKRTNSSPDEEIPVVKTELKTLNRKEDVLVWFGHSSYFLQIQGKTFLVDPVFSGYASPFSFFNKAFKGTNVYSAKDFPEIDYLIITHDHWDHLDYTTILDLTPKVKNVICGLGVGQYFEYWGYDNSIISELDWYEAVNLGDMELTATPARHYSGRGLKRNQTLWVSYILKTANYNLFLGGDSGYDTFYNEIGEKFGPFDMAILEQGQYNQDWNLIHLLPEQVFETARHLKAKRILPVHNSKFALARHAWDEPLKNITQSPDNIPVVTPFIGEVVYLADKQQTFSQWWKNN